MAEQTAHARFSVGQLVHHILFDYRGVIVDVDATFQGTSEWYEAMAVTRPPKDEPWYHILIHNSIHRSYVAQRNLEEDFTASPIDHPELDDYFSDFQNGAYVTKGVSN